MRFSSKTEVTLGLVTEIRYRLRSCATGCARAMADGRATVLLIQGTDVSWCRDRTTVKHWTPDACTVSMPS